ncbi:MAG: L-threonylcarbamoyladenylate synthase [Pseudomonadota bacterium]
MTEVLQSDAAGMARAAALLGDGQCVGFPTETVYGLGADACNGAAVARIFEAKGRPRFNPLIVHLSAAGEAERHAVLSHQAERLAGAFWPGPLTLVLPRRTESPVAALVTAGLDTVALRVPAHPVAQALIAAAGRALAAPSANPSGSVSPTTAAHVLDGLGGRIAAVLDGGACPVGVESTVIGFEGQRAVLLRPGGIPTEALETALGAPLEAPTSAQIAAPGMLASHYAPKARLRLAALAARPNEGWLGFGPLPATQDGPALTLSSTGDLIEAAANLFAHLRTLDRLMAGTGTIAVAPIPARGLGVAINDRLSRAAAGRGG